MLQVFDRGAELAQKLVANQHQIDLLLLEQTRLAAEFVQTDYWDWEGSTTPYDWIRFNCHLTSNAAGDWVTVGERKASLADSVHAVESGEIGFTHLVVMARTAEAVGERFDEAHLLEKARASSPGKFRYTCDHYRHAADPGGYAAEQFEKYEHRHLRLSRWEDGSLVLSGVLDPVEGVVLRTTLEPLARKSGVHDVRTREQRLADALVELAYGGKPANMQITASVETFKGLTGAAAGEMEFSLPVSSTTVQRMACDCSVMRILLDQESLVVNVGRSKRIISGPARRALQVRDGHCQWPGCERPASRCDGHHLVHWIHGGSTDLSNLVLLCHRHHWMVHEGGWQLVKVDDGSVMPIAPTVTFGLPRGPD